MTVWEGILVGQIVNHISTCKGHHVPVRLSPDVQKELERFQTQCGFYVTSVGEALSEVITKYVRDASKKTDALSQVELRKMLEPYSWTPFIHALANAFTRLSPDRTDMFVAIDGLDEHWDTSAPSLYFLAELLAVAKNLNAIFGRSVRFLVCLRDSIFRALVDTKSIEYDKLESLILNLEWNARSLFELIARRVAPQKRVESALGELRSLLPESIDDFSVEDYLARHILQRPRDYVNFFRMLQAGAGREPRAGEGHVHDALSRYCANRLMDLENEFGFTYPGISKLIAALHGLSEIFDKAQLLDQLAVLCKQPSFRSEAPGLMLNYGQPLVLARILLSIGAKGTYDPTTHSIRFVHEFSESRVTGLWEAAEAFSIHPVYCYRKPKPKSAPLGKEPTREEPPAILTHPPDYLAEKNSPRADLEHFDVKMERRSQDLLASLQAIEQGQQHYRRYELWVKDTITLCFVGDLLNGEEQITTSGGTKRFELIFDIIGDEPPWTEIKQKFRTHRLLVECKNTDEPTDADFVKLDRDMQALDLGVAFMAYRGQRRESTGKILERQRSVFVGSNRSRIVVTVSDAFLKQCLEKTDPEKCRKNFNALWRDHVHRWLQV